MEYCYADIKPFNTLLFCLDPIEPNFNGSKNSTIWIIAKTIEPLILECNPYGIPKPQVEWFKVHYILLLILKYLLISFQTMMQNKRKLKANDRHIMVVNQTNVFIISTNKYDDGLYECLATSTKELGTASISYLVKTDGKSKITDMCFIDRIFHLHFRLRNKFMDSYRCVDSTNFLYIFVCGTHL